MQPLVVQNDHLPVIDIEVQKPAVFSRSCAAPGDPPEETPLRIEHRKLVASVAYVVPSVVFNHLYHRPYQRRIARLKRDQAVAGQDGRQPHLPFDRDRIGENRPLPAGLSTPCASGQYRQ